MEATKILRADNKGRILLGSEFIGAYLGMQVDSNGIYLKKMKFIPETQNTPKRKEKNSANILKYAGAWQDMSDAQLNDFIADVSKRRKAVSKRKKV